MSGSSARHGASSIVPFVTSTLTMPRARISSAWGLIARRYRSIGRLMAVRTGAPIVPVYLPRDKRLFHHVDIVFGEPYTIEKAAHSDYEPLAQELMDKIWALKDRI